MVVFMSMQVSGCILRVWLILVLLLIKVGDGKYLFVLVEYGKCK